MIFFSFWWDSKLFGTSGAWSFSSKRFSNFPWCWLRYFFSSNIALFSYYVFLLQFQNSVLFAYKIVPAEHYYHIVNNNVRDRDWLCVDFLHCFRDCLWCVRNERKKKTYYHYPRVVIVLLAFVNLGHLKMFFAGWLATDVSPDDFLMTF